MTKRSSQVPSLDILDFQLTSEHIPQEELSDLEQERKRNEHKRTESFRKIYSEGINWTVRLIFGIIIAILLVVTWHHLMPEVLRWLEDEDLSRLHSVLFSGAVVSAVTMHINKNL